VAQLRKEKDVFYTTEASLPSFVEKGMSLQLSTAHSVVDIQRSEIPYETQQVEEPELFVGTVEVVQKGVAGEKETTTEISYQLDEELSRETISDKVLVEPIPQIVKVGTKTRAGTLGQLVESISELSYSKILAMSATAYTAGPESTGKKPGMKGYGITASGMMVERGVVAVDPKVIPLGTKLYVEGYGYAIAADTGGAIKGNKIDLYMDSLREARQYTRKIVNVYILR
jgi:3D (Asp-Asp-Asp) domain-containing protein